MSRGKPTFTESKCAIVFFIPRSLSPTHLTKRALKDHARTCYCRTMHKCAQTFPSARSGCNSVLWRRSDSRPSVLPPVATTVQFEISIARSGQGYRRLLSLMTQKFHNRLTCLLRSDPFLGARLRSSGSGLEPKGMKFGFSR